MSALTRGRPTAVWRSRHLPVSLRLDLRSWLVIGALMAFALALATVALASGDFAISVPEVVGALFGQATARVHMVVVEWRLPRVLMAVLLGGALGMAGAIFQSLTRNPLGSPDIIGFDAGSYTGALIVITLLGGGYFAIAGGALVGGLATALVVYLLAYRQGVQGFRLIIVGIGVSAMLSAFNTWLLLRAKLEVAMMAAVWGAGSLNGMTLERLAYAAAILIVLIPAALVMSRPMAQLELGDDAARAMGVEAEKSRLILLIIGVGLTAVVTATAGPIGFVALVAPQLARRLTGNFGVSLIPSAAMGGVLLLAADFIAQRAFAPTQLPVGVVTVSLGGVYFAWLLIREARR